MHRARRIAAVTCLSLTSALLPTLGHTAAAPSLVRDITTTPVGSGPGGFTRLGGDLLFFAQNRRLGMGLWKRTPEGTTEFVKRIESPCSGLQVSSGVLFFCADDGEHGRELWRSDGTPEGTFMVKDIAVGPGFSEPRDLTPAGDAVFFSASATDSGIRRLWKTDGTADGTLLVTAHTGEDIRWPRELTGMSGTLFFTAERSGLGIELWRSNGTQAGTRIVKDIAFLGSIPQELTAVRGTLYFRATKERLGYELWSSDGTAAGTHMVRDIAAGSRESYPNHLARFGRRLLFAADDGVTGRELWRSDGTRAGTKMIKDVRRGPGSSFPKELTRVKDRMYFSAETAAHGRELWSTDGSGRGTRLAKDIVRVNRLLSSPSRVRSRRGHVRGKGPSSRF